MNDAANVASNDSYPVAAWTWHDGKGGAFSTEIFADGQVRQERKNSKEDVLNPQKLGVLPAAQAAALLARCREALSATPAAQGMPGGETYELVVAESQGQKSSRHVARAALASDAALQAIRREILGARKQVARRWNMWQSAGARWLYVTLAVTLGLGLYIALDMKHDDQLQARAQKMTAIVTDRGGTPYKDEYLMVKLDDQSAAPPVKIFKYLSHPNWEASKIGSKVDVLYDAPSGQAWLAADLLRWQKDKKTIWVIPGFLLLAAIVGLLWLRRYEIGVYADGNEYMIREDRVVTDDKDAAISRSTLLWFKMFV